MYFQNQAVVDELMGRQVQLTWHEDAAELKRKLVNELKGWLTKQIATQTEI